MFQQSKSQESQHANIYSKGYITFGRALDFNATGEQFDQCRVAKDSLFLSFHCPLILAYWTFWSSLIALAELRKGKINVDSELVFYSKSNSGFACRLPELFYATYPHWCSYWSANCFQSEAVVINSSLYEPAKGCRCVLPIRGSCSIKYAMVNLLLRVG